MLDSERQARQGIMSFKYWDMAQSAQDAIAKMLANWEYASVDLEADLPSTNDVIEVLREALKQVNYAREDVVEARVNRVNAYNADHPDDRIGLDTVFERQYEAIKVRYAKYDDPDNLYSLDANDNLVIRKASEIS